MHYIRTSNRKQNNINSDLDYDLGIDIDDLYNEIDVENYDDNDDLKHE